MRTYWGAASPMVPFALWLVLTHREAFGQQISSSLSSSSVDLIPIKDFDVQIAVKENRGIQQREVSIIVTEWLNDSYQKSLKEFGYTVENGYAQFDSVGLLYNNDENTVTRRRNLRRRRSLRGELYTAKFKGGVVFSKRGAGEAVKSVPENDVLYIQQLTLFNDTALADRLKASEYESLGDLVIHATAYLNSVAPAQVDEDRKGPNLEAVIIAAISVAGVAFLLLLGAVLWSYRVEAKQEAFRVHTPKPTKTRRNTSTDVLDKTDTDTALDDTPEKMPPPIIIRHHHHGDDGDDPQYPESVISDSLISGSVVSEDVSASLSQYYRSGMGSKTNLYRSGALSDAGSVSSMESYGYSIDAGVMPLPSEVSLGGGGIRIGGLPVEPQDYGLTGSEQDEESASDVNLPDLDKELGHLLNIQLTPMDHTDSAADDNSFSFSDQDDVVSNSESKPMQTN